MTDTIRYEHIEGNRYRAILPGGAVEVHSTYERCYPGLPAPDGTPRGELHRDLYEWSIGMLAKHGDATRVADFACGSGYGSEAIRRSGYYVTGYDVDEEALAYARARYAACTFRSAELFGTKWPGSHHHAVVSVETIEHVDDDEGLVRRWADGCVAGGAFEGIVIITTPLWDGKRPLLTEHHCREYEAAQLADLLERCGFDVVHHEYPIGERRLHQGIVGVVR